MNIGFASDHRGFKLKSELIDYFKKEGYNVIDCGTNSEDACDYPDYAYKLGEKINNKEVDYGIAICGSGIGISIALNKIKGVYCAKVNNLDEVRFTRVDNNANCISFSASTSLTYAIKFVNLFINTDFSNLERHKRRIKKIKEIENGTYND